MEANTRKEMAKEIRKLEEELAGLSALLLENDRDYHSGLGDGWKILEIGIQIGRISARITDLKITLDRVNKILSADD